jgi:basic membrane protein A and related proteins
MRIVALPAALALAVAGCGEAPSDTTAGASGSASAANADFLACEVTDQGGVDDRSFNASAAKGVDDAVKELGISKKVIESNAETDYTPNVQSAVQDDCGIIVTIGFLLGDATKAAATANPEEKFAIVDFAYEKPIPNVKPLIFDTAPAAFLAGYVAAAATKTGTVATFGGAKIPTVTIFMDGFAQGIEHHNSEKGTSVKLLGWDVAKQNGSFTGDFQDQNKGKQLTQNFVDQGADIVMPVAGPVGLGAAAAAKAAGDVSIIGVDTDWYESVPNYKDIVLTSVVKRIDNAVLDAVKTTAEGSFSADPYVGTLDNEGVSIAPFHDFESKVPEGLAGEVEALQEKVVSGEVKVQSPSSPKA